MSVPASALVEAAPALVTGGEWSVASWLVYGTVCVASAAVLVLLVPIGVELAERKVGRWTFVLLGVLGVDAVITYQWALSLVFERLDWAAAPVAILILAIVVAVAGAWYSYRRYTGGSSVPSAFSLMSVLPPALIAVNGLLAFVDAYFDRLTTVLVVVVGLLLIPNLIVVGWAARRR